MGKADIRPLTLAVPNCEIKRRKYLMRKESYILIFEGRTGTPIRRPRRSVKRLMCRAKLGWMREIQHKKAAQRGY